MRDEQCGVQHRVPRNQKEPQGVAIAFDGKRTQSLVSLKWSSMKEETICPVESMSSK